MKQNKSNYISYVRQASMMNVPAQCCTYLHCWGKKGKGREMMEHYFLFHSKMGIIPTNDAASGNCNTHMSPDRRSKASVLMWNALHFTLSHCYLNSHSSPRSRNLDFTSRGSISITETKFYLSLFVKLPFNGTLKFES